MFHKVSMVYRTAEELVAFFVSYVQKLHDFFPCMHTVSQLYYVLR
jgi:hypothetical protein